MTQLILPQVHAAPLLPPRTQVRSPLRWAGAKRWLVPLVTDGIWKRLAATGGHYIEPFLGGGSIALDLGLPEMILADICRPLMTTYQQVVTSPTEVRDRIAWLVAQVAPVGINATSYYALRKFIPETPLDVAAQFLALNATCFNGVYRVNSKGEFNVPYGDRTEAHIADLAQLEAVAVAFATAELLCLDFRPVLASVQKGDVVVVDSPYHETFTGYTKGKFGMADQRDLAHWLHEAAKKGATFIATNSDFPEVRELYTWAEVFNSNEQRKVNSDGKGRKPAPCLIITNDPSILNLKTDTVA